MLKLTGYADKVSAAPGETISFMVNCDAAPKFKADIVRIVHGDPNPKGPGLKIDPVRTPANGTYPGRKQAIYAGSFVEVPNAPALNGLKSFTMQAFIWPTLPAQGLQGIIAKWNDRQKGGAALVIGEDGSAGLCLGNGKGKAEVITTGKALVAREWYFIAASYDAKTKQVHIVQEPLKAWSHTKDAGSVKRKSSIGKVAANESPVTIGAYFRRVDKGRTVCGGHYDGKIDSPRITNRPLSAKELATFRSGAIAGDLLPDVVAAWDFSKDIGGLAVTDISPNLLHGEVVNMPARAMKGHNWDGSEMNWRNAPEQYGAIHFHHDDLHDAGWEVDFSLTVPAGLKSGLYAARMRAGDSEDYIPFAVRPPRGKVTSKTCFLMPTASYMAYANESMAFDTDLTQVLTGRLIQHSPQDIYLNEHREYGGSLYDSHADGSGVCYSSRLRPILNMRPNYQSWIGGTNSTLWQFNADTHITDWLEAMNFDFDVVTDEDLHYEGLSAIEGYDVVITSSHPEYHSTDMWDAMDAYKKKGGRLMYLGANGWYWRIAFHQETPGIIEVRRAEDGIRTWIAEPGEYYMSMTGEYGGLWRRNGRPPQMMLGAGFTAQGFDISSYYVQGPDAKNPRAKFIMDGIKPNEKIGDFGLIGDGAAGLELDRADRLLGTPPDALVVASSVNHTDIYLVVCEEVAVNTPNLGGHENPLVRADIVFFDMPGGGAVWSTSSIAWAGSLSHNNYKNNVSRMTANVLKRFLDPKPF